MEKLAASPKAEQPFQQLLAMGRMVGTEGTAQPSPWQKLMSMVPKYRSEEGLQLFPGNIRGGTPTALDFSLTPKGMTEQLKGQLIRGEHPNEAYLSYMDNPRTSRVSVGSGGDAYQEYVMDMSGGPAQREFQAKGFQPPPSRQAREARMPGERFPLEERRAQLDAPRATLGQKQQAFDRLADVLRRAGLNKLAFSAEPGGRPELYKKITGYAPQPVDAPDYLGRVSNMIRDSFGGRRPAVGGRVPAGELSADHVESALGLSIDEAYDAGLVKEVGPHVFSLTEQGHAAARNWLGGS